jgi:redox-sensing transcriptional repressor
MDKKSNISRAVVKRLPKYHRYLKDLVRNNVEMISSRDLGKRIGFTASQIRHDLHCFGEFGQQGYGYNVKDLYGQISSILGISSDYKLIIIGAGNIGQALASYSNFAEFGYKIDAIFDVNPKLTRIKIRGIEIRDVDSLGNYIKNNSVEIAAVCIPARSAQKVCDVLSANGVKGIWNFAPVDLIVPEGIIVENVHLIDSLLSMTYMFNKKSKSMLEA